PQEADGDGRPDWQRNAPSLNRYLVSRHVRSAAQLRRPVPPRSGSPVTGGETHELPAQLPRRCLKIDGDHPPEVIQLHGRVARIAERDHLAGSLADDIAFDGVQHALRLESYQAGVGLRVVADALHRAAFQLA